MKNLKGQAAMEYLMTYGWSLFVIVIVIAALLYLNPFKIPEMCRFEGVGGFSCSESNPKVYTTNADNEINVVLKIYNTHPNNVQLSKVTCTIAAAGDITINKFGQDLPATKKSITAGASQDLNMKCLDVNGAALKLGPNAQFKGTVVLWYNFDNDPQPEILRVAKATVVSTVLEGTE